jgi:hypothetical protein
LDFRDALQTGRDCLTFVVYYLLLVGVVDTQERLSALIKWVVLFVLLICGLGLLIYFGYVDVQAEAAEGIRAQSYHEVQADEGTIDLETGELMVLARLTGVGVYNNPNDLSRILVVGIVLCMYCLGDHNLGSFRFLWALPIALFGFALQLTYSRGGFLALLTGIVTLLVARFGRTRSLLLSALILPVVFALFAGRITNIDTSGGTGQQRILIWRDAFAEMQTSPLFGIGVGQLGKKIGIVAHNSFVQCYAEMGMVGGTLFASSFYLGLWGIYRIGPYLEKIPVRESRRARPFLIAVVAGSIVGMFSSTRSYRVDTYLVLGLCTAYLAIIEKLVPSSRMRVDGRLLRRIVVVGCLSGLALYFYVRIAAQ